MGFTMRQGWGLAAALAGLVAAAPVHAQVTADQAAAMAEGLRGWAAGLFAPLIEAAAVPVTVTPDGERYRLEFAPTGAGIPGLTVTMSGPMTVLLRPLDGTSWAIDDYRLPTDVTASLDLGEPGQPPGSYRMHVTNQKISGAIDPGLTLPTRLEGEMSGISQTIEGRHGPQTTSMGKLTFSALWTPTGGSVMNGGSTSTVEAYASQQALPGSDAPLALSIRRVITTVKAEGVDLERIQALLRTASALGSDARDEITGKTPGSTGPTDAQRAAMHKLLEALATVFSRVEGRQEMSGLHFSVGGISGDLARFEMGSVMAAPAGNAELRLRIAAEGADSPAIPQGAIRQLLPKSFAIAPRVSGVPKEALMGFLTHAIDVLGDDDSELGGEAMQLLADNPVTIGIDELALDLGVARLGGTGQLQVASPAEITGAAELRMTGLDALIRLIGQLPETKAAVPVAVVLKGIGKAEGNETVWRIAYADGKATVNGTDLSALMPGGKHQ
jgi:hypothetical protein